MTIKALNYLLASSNRRANEQAEQQRSSMRHSLMRNEALGLDNQFCYLYEREHIRLDKTALFSLTNGGMVKLFVGRREIFDELRRVYAGVTEMLGRYAARGANIRVYGYEALSRITLKRCAPDIRQAFELARETRQLLELEVLCRKSTVRAAVDKPAGVRLFMNFDPNILRDRGHKSGVTAEKLEKKDIDYGNIVFEADERWADADREFYRAALNSYRAQGFAVAVDNMRSGYSGINGILDLNPQYVKLSRDMIRDIDSDEMKRSFASSLTQLARDAGIAVIATGWRPPRS